MIDSAGRPERFAQGGIACAPTPRSLLNLSPRLKFATGAAVMSPMSRSCDSKRCQQGAYSNQNATLDGSWVSEPKPRVRGPKRRGPLEKAPTSVAAWISNKSTEFECLRAGSCDQLRECAGWVSSNGHYPNASSLFLVVPREAVDVLGV